MSSRPLVRFAILFAIPAILAFGFVLSAQENDSSLVQARELRLNEIYLESARLYRSYVIENPEDMEARKEYAALLLFLDEPGEAAGQIIPVLGENPDDEEAAKILEESLAKVEGALDPKADPRGLLRMARLKRFAGDEDDALELYIRYLEIVRDDSLAFHELAQMVYDSGDTERGMALLDQAILLEEDEEKRKELLLKDAMWLSYEEETYDEAVEAFQDLILQYPDMAEAHLFLGDFYRYQGDYEIAGESYLKAIQYGGEDERATEGYYQVLLRTRALEAARIASMEGDYQQSAAYFEIHFQEMEATRARLQEIEILESEGRATAGQVRAADFFRRFIEETPDEAELRLEAADVYAQLEDMDKAINQLEKAAKLQPENREIRMRIARYQTYDAETLSDAAVTLDEMSESFGPDAELSTLRGDVYRYQADYVAARDAYRRALERNPNDPLALAGLEALDEVFQPGVFAGIGFTRDWSSDFDFFYLGGGVRNVFSAIEHRLDVQIDALYYRQPISTQNPDLSNNTKDVSGVELLFSLSGPIRGPWSYLVSLGADFYDKVDWTPIGRLGLGYATDQFTAVFGFRREEAVQDHYNLSALLDEVRMNDFYGQAIYQTLGDDFWERWQAEGYGETGWFSDGNYRSRVILTLLNRSYESEKTSVKVGIRGLYLNYDDESPNYFSPSDYTGIGPTGRLDHQFNEKTDAGFTATALWIEQVEEVDIAVGGYLYHQITDSARGSLRLDYGQSTFQQGDIRSISGRAEVEILF